MPPRKEREDRKFAYRNLLLGTDVALRVPKAMQALEESLPLRMPLWDGDAVATQFTAGTPRQIPYQEEEVRQDREGRRHAFPPVVEEHDLHALIAPHLQDEGAEMSKHVQGGGARAEMHAPNLKQEGGHVHGASFPKTRF